MNAVLGDVPCRHVKMFIPDNDEEMIQMLRGGLEATYRLSSIISRLDEGGLDEIDPTDRTYLILREEAHKANNIVMSLMSDVLPTLFNLDTSFRAGSDPAKTMNDAYRKLRERHDNGELE